MFHNVNNGRKQNTSRQSKLTWGKVHKSKIEASHQGDLKNSLIISHKENTPPGWITHSNSAFTDNSVIDLTKSDDKVGNEEIELEIIDRPRTGFKMQQRTQNLNSNSVGKHSLRKDSLKAHNSSILPDMNLFKSNKRELPWETAEAALKKQHIFPRIQKTHQTKSWIGNQSSNFNSKKMHISKLSSETARIAGPRSLSESVSAEISDALTDRAASTPTSLVASSKDINSSYYNSSIGSFSNSDTANASSTIEFGKSNGYRFRTGHDGSIVQLNAEQIAIYELALSGKSIFFTGAAGTGKSVLLKSIITGMRAKYGSGPEVAVTATTGMAALNIGGKTLHSWSGIGYGNKPADMIVARQSREVKERWYNVKVLIVDEVSMLDGKLLDLLDQIARKRRYSSRDLAFAGIQVILSGDFYQLPPVGKNNEKVAFAFQSNCWKSKIDDCFELKTVHRQKEDNELIEMLTAMRKNELTHEINKKFVQLSRQLYFEDGNEATRLFSLRRQVATANQLRLDQLPGRVFEFVAQDGGAAPPNVQKSLLDSFREEEVLKLKIGTQVMLVENKNEYLVNGSRGRIESFASEAAWTKIDLRRTQYHDYLEIYNAVLNGLNEGNLVIKEKLSRLPFKVQQEIQMFASGKASEGKPASELIPIVRFPRPGGTSVLEPMPRHENKVIKEDHNGKEVEPPEAFRSQIPLVLSYAMSIHKAQGQTIDRLIVDLNTIFAAGQAYVAVSRATTRDGLQVLNYSPSKVFVNKDVVQFYKQLD